MDERKASGVGRYFFQRKAYKCRQREWLVKNWINHRYEGNIIKYVLVNDTMPSILYFSIYSFICFFYLFTYAFIYSFIHLFILRYFILHVETHIFLRSAPKGGTPNCSHFIYIYITLGHTVIISKYYLQWYMVLFVALITRKYLN